jgi:flavin reductase (DIM6/NTAB) family NADH-FMN oxidoreductase RutF
VTIANLRSYHATRRLHEENQTHGLLQEVETSTEDVERSNKGAVEPAQLQDHVRHLMRKVPASVAVITVASHDPETNKHVPMGIAVSSLSTVTLDPPTVSFNIKQPSKALNAIRAANGRFRVHFLDGEGQSARVIEHFCTGNHPDAYKHRMSALQIHVPQLDENRAATASFAPQLQGNSIRAAAECTLTQELTVGDHVILRAKNRILQRLLMLMVNTDVSMEP